ncbi:MAG: BMP family ABC transporter substrate-binding protein [Lachnospiraceae bacterium]|nr:BMP family ABC transporter substrate-binding protein [Lachnospiraceae bacterium]
MKNKSTIDQDRYRKYTLIGLMAILAIILLIIFFTRPGEVPGSISTDGTKVGVIMLGPRDDKCWNQSHFQGLEEARRKLNLDVTYKETVPPTEASREVIEELIASGNQIIIVDSSAYSQYVIEAAERHPEVFFFHATGFVTKDNLLTYFGKIYEMRYLTGIVAGLQTKTNEIGYVAPFSHPEVIRGIDAFTLGVRKVNKNAKVYVKWTNSWNNDGVTEKATRDLLSHHEIDVLTMHSDSLKPLEVAEEQGIYSIGYNMDNSKSYPKSFLTAPIWNWGDFYTEQIRNCVNGKFKGKSYWEGVDKGMVDLAPLSKNVSSKVKERITVYKRAMTDGTLNVFYGPIRDQEGNQIVDKGECISDEVLLRTLDIFVEGVVMDED